MRVLIADPVALDAAEHPARRFLELLIGACKGYDRQAGPKAEVLLEQVGRLVKGAVESPDSPERAYGSAHKEFTSLQEAHEREILDLAKGIMFKERGEVVSKDAKLAVNREIITAVNGKKLPPILLKFLRRIWNKYLYVTYLRHGMDSEQWRQGVEDIHSLVYALSIRNREELFRFYTDERSRALTRVRVGASSIHSDEELGKRFFATMDSIHKQVADGKQPVIEEVKVSTPDLMMDLSAVVAKSGRETALDDMVVGRWYKLLERGLEIRCKLIEKNSQHGYCLFGNYSGIKTAKKSYSEILQSLLDGSLKKVDVAPVFGKALGFACRQIAEQIPKLESKARKVEQERAIIRNQKRQAEALENLRRIEEEHLREETRLLEESRAREREQARREAESRVAAQGQARERALQQILSGISKMQPGGWVELMGKDNQKITCKLGLKLKSSGKMIFVDRFGRKMQELMPEQLAEQIIDGSASISDYGIAFDETLGRLIADRGEQFQGQQS